MPRMLVSLFVLLVYVEKPGHVWSNSKSQNLINFQLQIYNHRRASESFNKSVTHVDTPHLILCHDSSHCHPFNFLHTEEASKEVSKSAKITISHSKPIFYISSNWSNRNKPILYSWALLVAHLNPTIVSSSMYVCGSYSRKHVPKRKELLSKGGTTPVS